ncbi:MAG: tripartite tricarboxylate transporter TctB family protein [Pseudomonadota bacterium]
MTLNRDIIVAVVLLLICGGLSVASLDIREPNYGQLSPATWPRIILAVFGLLSFIYLIQSLRQGPDQPDPEAPQGVSAFLSYWRNVIWCFVLFGAYLIAIPYVGILVGGMGFVFLLLTALGGFGRAPLHLVIAGVTVGGMWSIFTYALNVILPSGEWTGF